MTKRPELEKLFTEKKRLLTRERVITPDGHVSERTPLLAGDNGVLAGGKGVLAGGKVVLEEPVFTHVDTHVTVERVILKKHITLLHAIGLIIGGVAGSGIFISPTGVTKNAGSVGSSLILWTIAGMFNLLLALCYAELGTALPVAGGDYFYLKTLMGPLPAFLSLWTTTLLIAPCCAALMGRTVSAYLFAMFDVQCSQSLVIIMAILVTITAAALNSFTVKWSARILTAFSIAKLLALAVLIITGLVKLFQGSTSNFTDSFKGSSVDAGSLIAGFLPGFVSYVGWDAVNNLAEEMENPSRDLPLSVSISMLIVTFIYVMANVAYFSVLTPEEFVASDAVAMTFANKALGSVAWMIPIFVIMSAAGSAIGTFLSYPRYAFAGAREHQFPQMFSFVSLRHFTPIPAIILICLMAMFLSAAIFFDIQDILNITSVITQIKITLTLIALLRLKYTRPDLPSTIKVPAVLVITSIVLLVGVLCIAMYQDPVVNGLGLMFFLTGVPLYLLGQWAQHRPPVIAFFDYISVVTQTLFVLVPGGKTA